MSDSENPAIDSPKPKSGAPLTNQDWWPNQVDVSELHAHSPQANPLGDDFDYAKEFAKLDVDALKADVLSVITHLTRLVARRLRQLCGPVHPHELARRGHLPHLRRPRRRRPGHAALRAAQQLAGQRQPGQGASSALAGQEEVRQQDLLGRPDHLRRRRRRWSRPASRPSASVSADPMSGSPRRSSSAKRTNGRAPTSATPVNGISPSPTAPPQWA